MSFQFLPSVEYASFKTERPSHQFFPVVSGLYTSNWYRLSSVIASEPEFGLGRLVAVTRSHVLPPSYDQLCAITFCRLRQSNCILSSLYCRIDGCITPNVSQSIKILRQL